MKISIGGIELRLKDCVTLEGLIVGVKGGQRFWVYDEGCLAVFFPKHFGTKRGSL